MRGAGYNQSKARVPKKVYILVEILPVCDISIVDVWINWRVRPGAFQLFGSAATFRYCTVGSWLGGFEIKPVGEGGAGRWTVHHVICAWLLGSWWSTRERHSNHVWAETDLTKIWQHTCAGNYMWCERNVAQYHKSHKFCSIWTCWRADEYRLPLNLRPIRVPLWFPTS